MDIDYLLDEIFEEEIYIPVEDFLKLSEIQSNNTDHKVVLVREYGPKLFLYRSYKKIKNQDKTLFVYEVDGNDDTVRRYGIKDFLENREWKDDSDIFIGVDIAGSFSETFWEFPDILYHGTSEENAQKILKTGLKPSYETRGINNTSIGEAIFLTSNEEIAREYGEVVFKIDTRQMKKDGFMPEINLEPEVETSKHLSVLYHILDVEYIEEYSDTGISEETIIIYERIPRKYLSVIE